MGLFGADALAAHQLVLNVASLTFMIPLGIGQAAGMCSPCDRGVEI
jgi:MATE family multidrug resistance protein